MMPSSGSNIQDYLILNLQLSTSELLEKYEDLSSMIGFAFRNGLRDIIEYGVKSTLRVGSEYEPGNYKELISIEDFTDADYERAVAKIKHILITDEIKEKIGRRVAEFAIDIEKLASSCYPMCHYSTVICLGLGWRDDTMYLDLKVTS